jgi:hypothetical protein
MTRIDWAVAAALAGATAMMLVAEVRLGRAEPLTTYRDSMGRVTGYAQTRGNATVFTNERGQETGRAVRGKDGTVTFFNERGQQVGTARR